MPPFIIRLITSCHQKRAYYNYLQVATVYIVLFIAIYVIVLFLTIYVVAHDVTFTRILHSVAIIYGVRVAAKYNSN
jgi:uncharacterized membrane protein